MVKWSNMHNVFYYSGTETASLKLIQDMDKCMCFTVPLLNCVGQRSCDGPVSPTKGIRFRNQDRKP